jgi:hypothetical protein
VKIPVLLGMTVCLAGVPALADSFTVAVQSNSSVFGTFYSNTIASSNGPTFTQVFSVIPPTGDYQPPPYTPPPTQIASPPAPPVSQPQTASNPANPVVSTGTSSFTIGGSYHSLLSGTASYSGSASVVLSGAIPLVLSGYGNSIPQGSTITGAKLDLNLLIGSAVLSTGANMGNLNATPGSISVTISGGGISRTLNATSVSAYDLFANGFESVIAANTPLSISFNVTDNVSGGVTASMVGSSFFPVFFDVGSSSSFTPFMQSLNSSTLSDTRDISGSSSMTVFVSSILSSPPPSTPVSVLAVVRPPVQAPVPLDVPEPASMVLGGFGLLFLGYLRHRRNL